MNKELPAQTNLKSLDGVFLPPNRYWGAQTESALKHLNAGNEYIPFSLIQVIALIKKAIAQVNLEKNYLPPGKAEAIIRAAEEINQGKHREQFPLKVWQSGSGTQTNMNVNEVIATRASTFYITEKIHPNDDVNRFQSTNDVFPSAMHIVTLLALKNRLFPALTELITQLNSLIHTFGSQLKIGRTHLQDALPLSFEEEFTGYLTQIEINRDHLMHLIPTLAILPLGGTAVGNGLNAPPEVAPAALTLLSRWINYPLHSAPNKTALMAAHDTLTLISGGLKTLATTLFKIANDLRWSASGPHCGLGEINLPANEPGSSIMPGKTNPTQNEALMMIALQVMGNDTTISFANSQGNFELNTYNPLIIYNLLQSIELLADGCKNFSQFTLKNLTVNSARNEYLVQRSLMLATAFNPILGYDKVARSVEYALKNRLSLREAMLTLEFLSASEFDHHWATLFKNLKNIA